MVDWKKPFSKRFKKENLDTLDLMEFNTTIIRLNYDDNRIQKLEELVTQIHKDVPVDNDTVKLTKELLENIDKTVSAYAIPWYASRNPRLANKISAGFRTIITQTFGTVLTIQNTFQPTEDGETPTEKTLTDNLSPDSARMINKVKQNKLTDKPVENLEKLSEETKNQTLKALDQAGLTDVATTIYGEAQVLSDLVYFVKTVAGSLGVQITSLSFDDIVGNIAGIFQMFPTSKDRRGKEN